MDSMWNTEAKEQGLVTSRPSLLVYHTCLHELQRVLLNLQPMVKVYGRVHSAYRTATAVLYAMLIPGPKTMCEFHKEGYCLAEGQTRLERVDTGRTHTS